MNLTVIINCYNDPCVFHCIDSIDENVEIIVILVENKEIQQQLENKGIRYILTEKGNYSVNCNIGIKNALYDNIFIVDSDCIFAMGCLKLSYRLSDKYKLVRSRIEFLYENKFFSKAIATLRSDINNDIPIKAYTPGLLINRSIKNKLNGYFFDESISWASDSEFNYRVKRAGIIIGFTPESVIYHQPITLFHEIRSGYRLGRGQGLIVKKGKRENFETPLMVLKKFISGAIFQNYRAVYRRSGWKGLVLMYFWDIAYYIGFYTSLILLAVKN